MRDRRREEISAAVDGEGPMPPDLTAEERDFVDAMLALRGAVRVSPADRPPDVSAAVLRRIRPPRAPSRRPLVLAAAAAFVLAAVAGALAVRPGGPAAPSPAAAGIAQRVIDGQRAVDELHARVTVVERGVHPDIPERRLRGTLRYDAPETLWLHLEEAGERAEGWPPNDIDLVLQPDAAWVRGLDSCPVGAQPACLQPSRRAVRDLPPFAATWLSPLDLVMPIDAFLPVVATPATEDAGTVAIDATVARIERMIDGLSAAGAVREVHSTDRVRLVLDADTLTLRELRVRAADNLARSTWAATNGYTDTPGDVVLRVDVEPTDAPVTGSPPAPAGPAVSAGFTEDELTPSWPTPAGFELYRTGILEDGGPTTRVFAYRDGRAWIRVDVTDRWDQSRLFGSLGPLVRPVEVGDGVGYTDPGGTKLSLHTRDRDVLVTGSVDLDSLVAVGAGILRGDRIDDEWSQAAHVVQVPDGALVPDGQHIAVLDDSELIIGVGGPGSTGVVIEQAPATTLPPPVKADVVETTVRGLPARYSPRLGQLAWLEDGWRREIHAEGLDLDGLRAVADSLVEP